jgi:hypothetical protein
MRHLGVGCLILVCALNIVSATASAQPTPPAPASVQRYDRLLQQIRDTSTFGINPSVPAGRRLLVDYGGFFSPSYLMLQDQNDDTHNLRQMDLVAYGRLNLDGAHELYARARLTREDFAEGDSFNNEGNSTEIHLDRLFYRFDLQHAIAAAGGHPTNDNLVIEGGRQLVTWANGLVLNNVLDGAFVGLSLGALDITAVGGQTDVRQIDFDTSRPNYDSHTRRFFYGAMATLNVGTQRPFAYVLSQADNNSDETREVANGTYHFGYDSTYFGIGSTGSIGDKIVYAAEAVCETGRGQSDIRSVTGPLGFASTVPQQLDNVNALAGDFRLDYLLADSRHTHFSTEVILATGDQDRLTTSNTVGGNLPGTTDRSFNAFGLLNTGLAFNPVVSNIMILRAGVSTFPLPDVAFAEQLQVGADLFVYGKFTNGAPIDEPTDSTGQFLGGEPDVFLNWQIASDVTLAVRYGVFFPDAAMFDNHIPRQFFFSGVTFAF